MQFNLTNMILQFADACRAWAVTRPKQETYHSIPLEKQLELCISNVQMQRRVRLLDHRFKRYDQTALISMNIHATLIISMVKILWPLLPTGTCCSICSRKGGPDLFGVVAYEEYSVTSMSLFRTWAAGKSDISGETILKLYARDFGLQCLRLRGRGNPEEWRDSHISWWFDTHDIIDSIGTSQPRRWDPLM
jgi:hypothetical protein